MVRYLRTPDADEGTVFWSLKASLTDGRSDVFIPYLHYAGVAGFEPDFSRNTDIANDLSVGFTSGIGFKADGKEIQSSDATDPGNSAIDLDVRLTRRAAEPSNLDFVQIQATLDYQYVFSKEWSITLEPRLRVRWYDDPVDGQERRDIRPRIMVKAVWTPEWLTKKIKRAEIDFLLYGQRNFSTVKAEEFTQWEVGPSVLLAWKF